MEYRIQPSRFMDHAAAAALLMLTFAGYMKQILVSGDYPST